MTSLPCADSILTASRLFFLCRQPSHTAHCTPHRQSEGNTLPKGMGSRDGVMRSAGQGNRAEIKIRKRNRAFQRDHSESGTQLHTYPTLQTTTHTHPHITYHTHMHAHTCTPNTHVHTNPTHASTQSKTEGADTIAKRANERGKTGKHNRHRTNKQRDKTRKKCIPFFALNQWLSVES